MAFSAALDALDTIKPSRTPRTTTSHVRNDLELPDPALRESIDLTAVQVAHARTRLFKAFPRASTVLGTGFRAANQGADPCCSLVALVNMARLAHTPFFPAMPRGDAWWKRLWRSPTCAPFIHDGIENYAGLLDALVGHGCLDARAIAYVPMRSTGNRHNSFNTSFWKSESTVLAHFADTVSAAQYHDTPWLYQIGHFIETHLALGTPIAISALFHCRVAIDANAHHVLFVDSWDTNYAEQSCGGRDTFAAGFSTVDKWTLYSSVQDVVLPAPFLKQHSGGGAGGGAGAGT